MRAALAAAGSTVVWWPCRAPDLTTCADRWRHRTRLIAANRVDPTVDALADRAVAWFTGLMAGQTRYLAGLLASIFAWLSP